MEGESERWRDVDREREEEGRKRESAREGIKSKARASLREGGLLRNHGNSELHTLSSAKRSGISCSSQMCPSTQSAAARSVVSLRLSEISLQSRFRHLSPLMQEIVTEYAQKQPSNANKHRSSTIELK